MTRDIPIYLIIYPTQHSLEVAFPTPEMQMDTTYSSTVAGRSLRFTKALDLTKTKRMKRPRRTNGIIPLRPFLTNGTTSSISGVCLKKNNEHLTISLHSEMLRININQFHLKYFFESKTLPGTRPTLSHSSELTFSRIKSYSRRNSFLEYFAKNSSLKYLNPFFIIS